MELKTEDCYKLIPLPVNRISVGEFISILYTPDKIVELDSIADEDFDYLLAKSLVIGEIDNPEVFGENQAFKLVCNCFVGTGGKTPFRPERRTASLATIKENGKRFDLFEPSKAWIYCVLGPHSNCLVSVANAHNRSVLLQDSKFVLRFGIRHPCKRGYDIVNNWLKSRELTQEHYIRSINTYFQFPYFILGKLLNSESRCIIM